MFIFLSNKIKKGHSYIAYNNHFLKFIVSKLPNGEYRYNWFIFIDFFIQVYWRRWFGFTKVYICKYLYLQLLLKQAWYFHNIIIRKMLDMLII